MSLGIDTHAVYQSLTESGIEPQQADEMIKHLVSAQTEKLVTKDDLIAVRSEIGSAEKALRDDIRALKAELTAKIYGSQVAMLLAIFAMFKFGV